MPVGATEFPSRPAGPVLFVLLVLCMCRVRVGNECMCVWAGGGGSDEEGFWMMSSIVLK